MAIANDYNLDFNTIKTQYLKSKELSKIVQIEVIKEEKKEEELLDKVDIDGKQYYYEAKDKGIIYDLNSNPIGIYSNGKFLIS
jgi:hypothetical protein